MYAVRVVCEKRDNRGGDARRRKLEKEVKPAPSNKRRGPAVNVYESLESFKIVVSAPGVGADEFDLQLSEDRVVIACQRSAGASNEEAFRRQERWQGRFRREIRLSAKIRPDRVRAHSQFGVLEIVLPKWQQTPLRRVRVEAPNPVAGGSDETAIA